MKLNIMAETCCEVCNEIVHNHFHCPKCNEFVPSGQSEAIYDMISCNKCGTIYSIVEEGNDPYDKDCEFEEDGNTKDFNYKGMVIYS